MTGVQTCALPIYINAVQEANRRYEQGIIPKMLMNEQFIRILYKDVIEEIFSKKTKAESLEVIKQNSKLWTQMQSGSQGISGKKTINAMTMFDALFTFENVEPEVDEEIIDSDDAMMEVLGE